MNNNENLGDGILSVKDNLSELNDTELIHELWSRFKDLGQEHQKALAEVIGVAPSRVSHWKDVVQGGLETGVNNATRDRILSVLRGEDGLRLDGVECAAREIRAVVEKLERIVEVSRALTIKNPEGQLVSRPAATADYDEGIRTAEDNESMAAGSEAD